MTPIERYQADLKRPDFFYDAAQENAVRHLQRLYDDLLVGQSGGLSRLFRRRKPIKGLYFWGGVGRGKTYLVDVFFEALPFEQKMRTHFHRFMKQVHEQLTVHKGEKNPLKVIAAELAEKVRILCFDEFFVSDITDAMILGTLFEELFKHGITLVATSNIVPDDLYKDGLQRSRFLPVIALIEENTEVVNVDSGIDYRLRVLEQANLYHYPNDDAAQASMEKTFRELVTAQEGVVVNEGVDLIIEGRAIRALKESAHVAWFEFRALCDGPRSQNDYIDIAQSYLTVLLSNVEQMDGAMEDIGRRFINLVDEFYDRGVKLIISAAVPLDNLYTGTRLQFEFQRTLSRLQEMQSHEYLEQPHRH